MSTPHEVVRDSLRCYENIGNGTALVDKGESGNAGGCTSFCSSSFSDAGDEDGSDLGRPVILRPTASPLLMWCTGVVHLRGVYWPTVSRKMIAAREATPLQQLHNILLEWSLPVVLLLLNTPNYKPKMLTGLRKSKLEVVFQYLCSKSMAHNMSTTGHFTERDKTTPAAAEAAISEYRRYFLLGTASEAIEDKKRYKYASCLLVIGCGYNHLPDLLLGIYSLICLRHDAIVMRPEALKVIHGWSHRVSRVPLHRGGSQSGSADAFKPFSCLPQYSCTLRRPDVPDLHASPTVLEVLMFFSSHLQILLSCDPPIPEEPPHKCLNFREVYPHTDVVLTLLNISMLLTPSLDTVEMGYILFTILKLLSRNLRHVLDLKISSVPPSMLSFPITQTNVKKSTPDIGTEKTKKKPPAADMSCTFHDAVCKASVYATATMKKLRSGVKSVPDKITIALLREVVAIKSISALVGCQGTEIAGMLHNALHAVFMETSVERQDTSEELLLLAHMANDAHTLHKVFHATVPAASKTTGLHQLIQTCVQSLVNSSKTSFTHDESLMSHLACTVGTLTELCMDIVKGWVACILPLCEAEADTALDGHTGNGLPPHAAALDSLLSFVLLNLEKTRCKHLFTLLSVIQGAYVSLLTPSSALGDVASFILNGKKTAPSRSRLLLASHTTSSLDNMLAMFKGDTLPDIPASHQDWSSLVFSRSSAQWTTDNGLPTIQATITAQSTDTSALVICVTLPPGVSTAWIQDCMGRVSSTREHVNGTKAALFVIAGKEALVTVQVPNIFVGTDGITVKWLSLPKRMDPHTESLLLGCWLCGAAASAALVLSRVDCSKEEEAGSAHLRSPLFLYGMEERADCKDEKRNAVAVFEPPIQDPSLKSLAVSGRLMSGDPVFQSFYSKLCAGSGEAKVLHDKLKGMGPVGSPLMQQAVRSSVAALLKHSEQRLTTAATDLSQGEEVDSEDEAALKRLWQLASKVGLYLMERKQAWQLATVDELAQIVIDRARLLLSCRYYRDAKGTSSKRSSLFEHVPLEGPLTPEEITIRLGSREVNNSRNEQLVMQFLTPALPLPEQPLGLEETPYHSSTLPYSVCQAVTKANQEVLAILTTLSRREYRVPHCIAALRFGCRILRHVESAEGLWCRLRGVFLNTLALGYTGHAQMGEASVHPLASLEGVGHVDVALLQNAFNQLCTIAVRDLPELLKDTHECIPVAILSWVPKEVRPGDVGCLEQLQLIPTLLEHMFAAGPGMLLQLIVATVRSIITKLVAMLDTWVEWEPYCYQTTETVKASIERIVQKATVLLYENMKERLAGDGALLHSLELLIILEQSEVAREVTQDTAVGDDLLQTITHQAPDNELTHLVIAFLSQRFLRTKATDPEVVSILVGQLFKLLGRSESVAYLQQRSNKMHVIVNTLAEAFVSSHEILSQAVTDMMWDVVGGMGKEFKKLVRGIEEQQQDMQALETALAALLLLGGSDLAYQEGDEVEVWMGDPAHVQCCGAEHVLSSGSAPHGVMNKWVPATIVNLSILSGQVTCIMEGGTEAFGYGYDVVRHKYDGFLLSNTVGAVEDNHFESLLVVLETYQAHMEGIFKMKAALPLTCLGIHFANKCLKLLGRLLSVRSVPSGMVNRMVKVLAVLANRGTGMKVKTWKSPMLDGIKLKSCTVAACGTSAVVQPAYICKTCTTSKKTCIVCSYCIGACHASHDHAPIEYPPFTCECTTHCAKLCCVSMGSIETFSPSLLSAAKTVTIQILGLLACSRQLRPTDVEGVVDHPDHSFKCLRELVAKGHDEATCMRLLASYKGDIFKTYQELRNEEDPAADIGVYYGIEKRLFIVGMKKWRGNLEKCVKWCKQERGTLFPNYVYDWGKTVDGGVGVSRELLEYLEILGVLQASKSAGEDNLHHKKVTEPPPFGTVVRVVQGSNPPVLGISTGTGDKLLTHVSVLLPAGILTVPIAHSSISLPDFSISTNEPSHTTQLHACLYRSLKDVLTLTARDVLTVLLSRAQPEPLARSDAEVDMLGEAIRKCLLSSSWGATFFSTDSQLTKPQELGLNGLQLHTVVTQRDEQSLLSCLLPSALENIGSVNCSDQLTVVTSCCLAPEECETVGHVDHWGAASSLIVFKTEVPESTLVVFATDEKFTCPLWMESKPPRDGVLVLPVGSFWYKITHPSSEKFPVHVTLHILPLCQQYDEGLALSRPDVSFGLDVCHLMVQQPEDMLVTGNVMLPMWDACMKVVKHPYAPMKAKALEVMNCMILQIYEAGPQGRPATVLTDLMFLRVQSEHMVTAYKHTQRCGSFPKIVELLSLARKFVRHDICSLFCLPNEGIVAWADVRGRGMCPACAMSEYLRTGLPITYKPTGKSFCRTNSAKNLEWVTADDFGKRIDSKTDDGPVPLSILGTEYDGCLLVPFMERWMPSPGDYYETCLWLDKVAITRRCLEYVMNASPHLPSWLVHEVAVETVKQVRVEETNHCYDLVNDTGVIEISSAQTLFVTIDKQSRTHESERLLLSTVSSGQEDVGSLGGEDMGTSIVVQGNKLFFHFETCLEYCKHDVNCHHCSEPIVGIRYCCSVCAQSLCSECVDIPGVHYPQHLFIRILRPVVKPIRTIPVLYPLSHCKVADFEGGAHSVGCNGCGIFPIATTRYWCMHCHAYNLCQECVARDQRIHDRAHVFLRVKQPLPEKLPRHCLPCDVFYDKSDEYWGWGITVTSPNTPSTQSKMKLLHSNIARSFDNWARQRDPELVKYVQQEYYREWNTVEGYTLATLITPTQGYDSLQGVPHASIRFRFVLLRILNQKLEGTLEWIEGVTADKSMRTLAGCVQSSRQVMFSIMKMKEWESFLLKTSEYERPTLSVKMRRMHIKSRQKESIFEHAAQSLLCVNSFLLKTRSPPWKVTFMGEASDDYGGPFRDLLTDMCDDLTNGPTPLLLSVPNGVSQIGSDREMALPDTMLVSDKHRGLYKFIGRVMGVAIRSKTVLPFDLPAVFWKVLTNEEVTEKDFHDIDSLLRQTIIMGVGGPAEISDVGGRVMPLAGCLSESFKTTKEMLTTFKKKEAQYHASLVRDGLCSVVPEKLLSLVTWEELRSEVCGATDIDIHLLQKNTIYEGFGELTPVITFLWKALWDFSPAQRSLFLKFVWGRSRLNQSDSFPVPMKVRRLIHDTPDAALPTSHTCFFSLELPAYSHFEVLRERLLYAVTHCNVIDTDFAAHVVDGQL